MALEPGYWQTGTAETFSYDPATGDKLLRYLMDVTGLPAMFFMS